MQAIYDWGGLEMADKAVSFAQNSPKINRLLKMVNIDPVKIRAELNTAPPVTQSRSSSNFKPAGDTYKDRLKKLG